ncbi:MAG: DUF3644 domain-containing protein [Chloroflexi bacterium]|nr:DUF3644 domain-containing protein [Chloroflexota bacterium]
MVGIKPLQLQTIVQAFERRDGPGFVLDFSDRTFGEFFAHELGIDINDPKYAVNGSSKLKRLKCFLGTADDATAARVLRALWDYRVGLGADHMHVQPLVDSGAKLQALIQTLEGKQSPPTPRAPVQANAQLPATLKRQVLDLAGLDPQPRGYAFEKFLKDMFNAFGLEARDAFRLRGEQIDGSFQIGSDTYLLEAKWQNGKTGIADLHAFHGKIDEKAAWARGLFISVTGFSEDGLHAFGRGKKLVCMDGRDLYDMLDRGLPFPEVLQRKVRRAAETGSPYASVADLFL